MIRISRSCCVLLLAFVAITLWPAGLLAGNGYVLLPDGDNVNGRKVPMCREILKIMNLSENANTINGYDNNPISFPRSSNKFTPTNWGAVTFPDIEKYFDVPRLQKGLEIIKQDSLAEKSWDGKGEFLLEKTHVDFDGTGNTITLVRYRLPTWKHWTCLLGNEAPPSYIELFNYGLGGGRPIGTAGQCTAFVFGGRFYFADSSGYTLTVYRPHFVESHQPDIMNLSHQSAEWKNSGKLYNERICVIQNSKGLDEFAVRHHIRTGKE